MKKFLCLITLLPLVTCSNPSEDDCNQKKDQSSCDALGCSSCTAGAVSIAPTLNSNADFSFSPEQKIDF